LAYISASSPDQAYINSPTLDAPFSPKAISTVGASQPHDNMQPYLVLNFCISLFGIYPSQN
jgi:microcystin-dependent protein